MITCIQALEINEVRVTALKISTYYNTEVGVIVATPVGEVTIENVRTTVKEAMKLSKVHQCNLLLFDIRNCPLGQTLLDAFEAMRDLKNSTGLDYTYKLAVVYNPDIYPKDRAQFIENVVENRANPKYRMFTDFDESLAWLMKYKKRST